MMMRLCDFPRYLGDYLKSLQQQGKSAHTVAGYRRDLEQLFSMLPESDDRIQRRDLVAVLKKLSQQQLAERSLQRKLSAWRRYAGYLVECGYLETNPMDMVKAPKSPQLLPKAVDQEQLNHMLDNDEVDSNLTVRDHAVIELMYGSGLRLSEVCGLNVDDVLLDSGWVQVRGKGNKQRQVPLSGKSIEAIRGYLNVRVAEAGEAALFTGKRGKRLGQRQLQNRINAWAVRNGCPQHLTPHMLRHSYASHLLQAARDIRAVQELLGHASLSSTQIYTKLDFVHLAQTYDALHPRAKRRK